MRHHLIPTLIIAVTFAGCSVPGGGGSDDSPPAPTNQAPVVSAGAAVDAGFHDGDPLTTTLSGSATDDNFGGTTLTVTWAKLDGPGAVVFDNAHATSTTVTVDTLGTYHLRLTGTDGTLTSTSDVAVTISRPFITVLGVEFDTRSSTSGFSSPTADTVNLYRRTDTSTVEHQFIAIDQVTYVYSSETVSLVPCTRVQGTWDSKGYTDGVLMAHNVWVQDVALAKAVDTSVRVMRASTTYTTIVGGGGGDGTWSVDVSASLPLFMPALPVLPAVFNSVALFGNTPGTVVVRRVDSEVLDTPNGLGPATKVGLSLHPSSSFGDLTGGFGVNDRPQFWQAGKGIVDVVGWTRTPTSVN